MWPILGAFTVGAGWGGFELLQWIALHLGGNLSKWMQSPGPWTVLIVLAGLPVGLFVWLVRDRNKVVDRTQQERHHQDQIAHGRIDSVNVRFQQLQEWASGGVPVLQAAAIHQLRPYIVSDPVVLPTEICGEDNPFVQPAMEILRALLDDRSWLDEWKKSQAERAPKPKRKSRGKADGKSEAQGKADAADEARRSPTLRAIESKLRDEGMPWEDFSGWNLAGLDLREVKWNERKFNRANLNGAVLSKAELNGAFLNGAELNGAFLNRAELNGAELFAAELDKTNLDTAKLNGANLIFTKLNGANLNYAELNRTILIGAKLKEATLISANLHGADFRGADLTGAKVENKWRPEIDWKALSLIGMPEFVENETPDLPPPVDEEKYTDIEATPDP